MAELPDELIPTRATLIQRLKNWQDQASWEDFFETYWQLIYRFGIQNGLTQPEAQDVVQETMFSVARHMPAFKYDPVNGSFKAWLLNITRWRITDLVRARETRADYQESIAITAGQIVNGEPAHTPPELEKLWDAEWEKNLLTAALTKARRQLNPQQYQIFDLNVNKGWTAERIAKTFALSPNQVYLAKHRVAEMIKQEMERLQREIV